MAATRTVHRADLGVAGRDGARTLFGQLTNLLKLRIGVIMMLTALAAMMITPGPEPSPFEMLVLAFAVLISAGSAGAFNQYYEVDLDRRVARTCTRPFVTGYFRRRPLWLAIIGLLLVAGVGSAALVLNVAAAVYIFLGAFFYAIVYTVWLKRRSWTNIVIGGASGSFAVLAGAAAVDPGLGPVPIMLAVVLFLWTPSHFWSLAIAKNRDYSKTGVPMLPVIIGNQRCARVVMANTLALVAISVLPFFYGMSWIYLLAAVAGGGYFVYHNYLMIRDPSPRVAMKSFFTSLLQLVLLLVGAVLDVLLLG
ncbi:MAG: heme o synthase [Gammaproteobacteria bacterium]|nr:heme o synthase [Gammaproteobacteria bacterium]